MDYASCRSSHEAQPAESVDDGQQQHLITVTDPFAYYYHPTSADFGSTSTYPQPPPPSSHQQQQQYSSSSSHLSNVIIHHQPQLHHHQQHLFTTGAEPHYGELAPIGLCGCGTVV
jgi:hypothetical protein